MSKEKACHESLKISDEEHCLEHQESPLEETSIDQPSIQIIPEKDPECVKDSKSPFNSGNMVIETDFPLSYSSDIPKDQISSEKFPDTESNARIECPSHLNEKLKSSRSSGAKSEKFEQSAVEEHECYIERKSAINVAKDSFPFPQENLVKDSDYTNDPSLPSDTRIPGVENLLLTQTSNVPVEQTAPKLLSDTISTGKGEGLGIRENYIASLPSKRTESIESNVVKSVEDVLKSENKEEFPEETKELTPTSNFPLTVRAAEYVRQADRINALNAREAENSPDGEFTPVKTAVRPLEEEYLAVEKGFELALERTLISKSSNPPTREYERVEFKCSTDCVLEENQYLMEEAPESERCSETKYALEDLTKPIIPETITKLERQAKKDISEVESQRQYIKKCTIKGAEEILSRRPEDIAKSSEPEHQFDNEYLLEIKSDGEVKQECMTKTHTERSEKDELKSELQHHLPKEHERQVNEQGIPESESMRQSEEKCVQKIRSFQKTIAEKLRERVPVVRISKASEQELSSVTNENVKLPFKKRLNKRSELSSKADISESQQAFYSKDKTSVRLETIETDHFVTQTVSAPDIQKLSPKRRHFEQSTSHESPKKNIHGVDYTVATNLEEVKAVLQNLSSVHFSVSNPSLQSLTGSCGEQIVDIPSTAGPSYPRHSSPKKESPDENERFSPQTYFNSEKQISFECSFESDPSFITEDLIQEEGNGFVDISYDQKIQESNIKDLLKRMKVNHYAATKTEEDVIYSRCKGLYEKDYLCEIIDNSGGALSVNYPIRLLIPVEVKRSEQSSRPFDSEKYKNQVKSCHTSRCRTRFATPVILWNKKFICRSGTLSVRKSAVYETVTKPKDPKERMVPGGMFSRVGMSARSFASNAAHRLSCAMEASWQLLSMSSIERVRVEDRDILESLNVIYICDLMVEDRKIVKQIRVSSSEKINMGIYKGFEVEQMPYPGCEFFGRYRKAGRKPEGLIFNWSRWDVNTVLKLTQQEFADPSVIWENYKEWDVVELTQNYMALILTYLVKGEGGLLIHCISGWDRTPLFISLLRISLWADGAIHQSLSAVDIIYLTLAYDWYLFGHNLPARLKKGEEIMHFCFKFLPYIADEKYSVMSIYRSHEEELEAPLQESTRALKLNFISEYVLSLYEEYIMPLV